MQAVPSLKNVVAACGDRAKLAGSQTCVISDKMAGLQALFKGPKRTVCGERAHVAELVDSTSISSG